MTSSSKTQYLEGEVILVTNFTGAAEATFTPEQAQIKPCNYIALLDIPTDRPHFKYGAKFLERYPLKYALTHVPVGITAHLQQFLYTAHGTTVTTDKGNQLPAIEFTTTLGTYAFTTGVVRAALKLPARGKNQQWASAPSREKIVDFLDQISYVWPIDAETQEVSKVITKIEKKRMPAKWQYIFTHVIQCLGTKGLFGSNSVKT